MKLSPSLVGLSVLIIIILQSHIFATEDFQLRPPTLVYKVRPIEAEGEVQTKPNQFEMPPNMFARSFFSPFIYYALGIQTESSWFDRRVNWASYSTEFVIDTGSFGFRYRSASAAAGRDSVEIIDTRLDLYGYYLLDFYNVPEFGLTRIGGGISYFDIDPYQGQEFLNHQKWAVFANIMYLCAEVKFSMLINDDFYNGGLFEFKIFNPLLYLGFQKPDMHLLSNWWGGVLFLNAIIPYEFGITGSFGLPNDADGWGWYVKSKYSFIFQALNDEDGHLSLGAEIYWSYRDGFSNTEVSGGWEFGIKFVLVGF